MSALTEDVLQAILSASTLLTGYKRRQYQAEMAEKYYHGSARLAETTFGWGRAAVETGRNERRSGIRCPDAYITSAESGFHWRASQVILSSGRNIAPAEGKSCPEWRPR